MADVNPYRKYIFDRDFTAVKFQEFQAPPQDTSNKSYLKGTVVDAVIKVGFGGDYRVVTAYDYDITEGVSLAPEVVVVSPTISTPVMNPRPVVTEPIFTRGEKSVIFVVILVLVIVIIANEAK